MTAFILHLSQSSTSRLCFGEERWEGVTGMTGVSEQREGVVVVVKHAQAHTPLRFEVRGSEAA